MNRTPEVPPAPSGTVFIVSRLATPKCPLAATVQVLPSGDVWAGALLPVSLAVTGIRPAVLWLTHRMSAIDRLLRANAIYAARFPGSRPQTPKLQLAVVACMDSRLDVFAALGLGDGEAHVLRNAGGVITDDVIRSLAISQRKLGTREVMLIHHTDCGMQKLTDDGFRSELQEATGTAPAFAIESFADVDVDVRQSILRVRRSGFLLHRDAVRGFVYDVDTHRLREIRVDEQP